MACVFVVEDDLEIARLMRYHLERASYQVQCFTTAASAYTPAKEASPSIFILDIMLPGECGLDFCRRLRADQRFANSAVIFVSAKISEADRVLGLDLGADDYITKPFSPREFLARVNAVMRRSTEPLRSVLQFANVEIDFDAMSLRVNGVEQETTAMEFRVLATLAGSPERVFSREHLLRLCGTNDDIGNTRSIDVYISRLREKIDVWPGRVSCLRTVRGVGYMFSVPKDLPENS